MAIRILIDNNKSRLVCATTKLHELREEFKLRAPGYFFSPAYRRRVWDGYVRYITETGLFSTGLLSEVCELLDKHKWKYKIEDDGRDSFKDLHEIKELNGKVFRGYQAECVKALLNNRYKGIKYIRGILQEATNAGKNIIAAGIMQSFSSKRKGLFLIDNSVIYEQAIKELSELMPGEIGQIRGSKIVWNRLTICMVQSLSNLLKKDHKAKAQLAQQSIVLVDEADTTATKKVGKFCISYCLNAPIRVALSGTPLHHKEKTRNKEVVAFFGPVIHKTSNKDLVDQGFSAKPHIKILMGNQRKRDAWKGDYKLELDKAVIKNKRRNRKIWRIVRKSIDKERSPVLILIQYHEHIKQLMKVIPKDMYHNLNIDSVHGETGGRDSIFERFKKGKIDVLIASMIIRRGKNLPIMQTLINAAGGDSHANALQILGRGLRKVEGKKEHLYFYDFYDEGYYVKRHAKHRIRFYKEEGFRVQELYKKVLLNL